MASSSNPFLAFWTNQLTLWEIWWATPQVMTHRLTRMARAGHTPSVRDQREFSRMGTEKVDAFSRAGWAMGLELWRAQQQWWLAWLRAWPLPGGTLTLPRFQPVNYHRVMARGMAPVHRRVTANAKRLGRLKL
ncbi:polyhydroxyalkanoate granule-associated phasin [Chitiniphilus eburneus]|uniref:Uncharacterized protein n=1 Tax=Chitiniphilus eburneus TaxID=2571148 RepID=A0A4V5MU47_9NEIS|nr:polyhydroxyalkanoate granule-associated phasin [Chitiniphilus eburneus]TJZ78858.1 hypothetical protein FAZ21_00800 [Chitiniphilus eburneus]